jgi:hypothetical protein
MKPTTIKADLHVHSPASADYLGEKSVKGYTSLIKAFADEKIQLLALTDHNTINGYLEYSRQAETTRNLYQLMIQRADDSEYVQQLKQEIECMDRVQVFPGVEISVYPSLHIILIFDPEVVSQVSDFLRYKVELNDAVDCGDPNVCSKHSAVSVLDMATAHFKDRFFCILPHVESSKGGWSELQGNARADLFKDTRVIAAQFSNPDTPEIIKKALSNRAYKRKSQLSFIQSSDYHGAPNVRPASQYIELDTVGKIDFDSLRGVLGNQSLIKCSFEGVEAAMKDFVDGRDVVAFDFTNEVVVSDERKIDLIRALCGVLNSKNALLRFNLFNVASFAEKGGEKIAEIIEQLRNQLDRPDSFPFKVASFSPSNSRLRFIVEIDRVSKIRLFENCCWIVEGGTVVAAKSWQIEQIVLTGYYRRFGRDKKEKLEEASKDILRIANGYSAMSIGARIDRLLNRRQLGDYKLKVFHPKYPEQIRMENYRCNGVVAGDCYILRHDTKLKGGRLDDQRDYYRFSVPQYVKPVTVDLVGPVVPPRALLVFPDGGVNVSFSERPIYAPFPVLVATLDPESELAVNEVDDLLLGTCAWMKSSFVLWYVIAFHQTDDLFDVFLRQRRVPVTQDTKFLRKLGVYGRNILNAEESVLAAGENLAKDDSWHARWTILADKHNKTVAENMHLIDREILRHLEFNRAEAGEVYRALRTLDLCDYGIGAKIEDFLDDAFGK